MWEIGQDQTLKNNHSNTLKYGWGLVETDTNSGLFYIQDKAICKPTAGWYSGPKIQTPQKTTTTTTTPKKTTPKTKKPQQTDSNKGRRKRAISGTSSVAALTCPTQAFMGSDISSHISPVEFNETDTNQRWKLYQVKKSKYFKLCLVDDKAEVNWTCVSATKNADEFESKQNCGGIIAANVENFRTFEGNTRKVISVLLGFFVATIVKRWWDQTSKIPRLEKLAISLNAIMQEGKNLIYKKESIVKY